mmetsp:Transcript_7129/g.10771  ORF Transcript_7129/g.10771 Transcript_7129/m.10771 type:complete len:288 (-) Transcript_7129:55-918(-)
MQEVVKDFAAGTMAGMSCKVVEYPLDTVKVRLQDSRSTYRSSINCFGRMFREEGLLSFYRGVTAPLFGCMLETAIAFAAYGRILALFERWRASRGENVQLIDNFASGCSAGIALGVILTPIELVKCRMQIQETLPHWLRPYRGSFHCVLHILREEGIRGLFVGIWPTLLREIPGNGVWYGAYEASKAYFTQGITNEREYMYRVAAAGSIAGFAYWSAFFPADVVKTRMQTEAQYRHFTFSRAIQEVYREGGIRGLYKGWGITIVRAMPAHAALFVTYESIRSALDAL